MAGAMSTDLVAFLNARLDEDEIAALDASDKRYPDGDHWWSRSNGQIVQRGYCVPGEPAGVVADTNVQGPERTPHMTRHDPARVLREVAAKRARLAYYEAAQAKLDHIVAHPGEMTPGDEGVWLGKTAAARMACRYDAAVYGDHPDYRQEWAPTA
jgi:hypothetical protein